MHSLGLRWPSWKRDRGIIYPLTRVYGYDKKTVVQVFPKLKELAEDPPLHLHMCTCTELKSVIAARP